jgi:hypothetical protein
MATGLIQDKMARPEGDELTQEAISSNIKMPPELQKAYDKVVIAGMKVMFSKETHRIMLKELQRGGPLADRLGKGIAGLMLLLFNESNKTMPPAVIIPAGMELMMQAVDFLRKSGLEKVTNQDIGDGMEQMISIIAQKFGASPDSLQKALSQFDNQNVNAAAQQMGA